MQIEYSPSPNYNERPKGAVIDTLVFHADANPWGLASTLKYIGQRHADPRKNVSYHTCIGRTGKIFSVVAVRQRAWACGESEFMGRRDVNDFSVSLCLSNRNDGRESYPDAQRTAAALYVHSLLRTVPSIKYWTTHRAIARPVGRKSDPLGLEAEEIMALVRQL